MDLQYCETYVALLLKRSTATTARSHDSLFGSDQQLHKMKQDTLLSVQDEHDYEGGDEDEYEEYEDKKPKCTTPLLVALLTHVYSMEKETVLSS